VIVQRARVFSPPKNEIEFAMPDVQIHLTLQDLGLDRRRFGPFGTQAEPSQRVPGVV
jgi:hypothetical protein